MGRPQLHNGDMSAIDAVRARINDAVLARVAGPEGDVMRERIHGTAGPRWFPPGSPIRRVHGDTSMYPGGIRALLLQSLHPLAMAAVADHSGYRSDPWGRLARTSTFLAVTTFGVDEDAEAAVRAVRRVHARISGFAPDGRRYRADDPHLLTWVHVAEVDSFLAAHQRYGREPLTPDEADEYVAQTAVVARRLGAVDVPTTTAELAETIAAYRPELEGTRAARETARFLLLEAPLPLVARPPYALLTAAAVGLMPTWARAPLMLPHLPILERTAFRLAGHGMVGGLRWVVGAPPVQPTGA